MKLLLHRRVPVGRLVGRMTASGSSENLDPPRVEKTVSCLVTLREDLQTGTLLA